ncbi:BON domain-containing protein [Pseudodesulfovibrio sp. zrk46]|uniref:BON domain-containing protein n=1 Tax=Pseudodesulfovibrio sp. zrk46 TaxID=2725288 RepID=UPI0014492225|nr:BON domain-containing protein [Pseudodesulfovibrio sp. zrk46]QJB56130.1 BON domain-containing protein [Pseudodesulfovibrio sp. zrk46]
MKKLAVILTLLLLAALAGGCAVVPALVTTGASMAVPQTASLAITAAGTVHKTALVAADERDVDDMMSDKMLTIQAEAILLTEPGTDVEAMCLNGDMYVAGEYDTPEDRETVIRELGSLKGVKSVKGVLKQTPTSLVAQVEPTIRDKHAESVIQAGLIKELHIKSANVDVFVVQGEAVVFGVVKDQTEAERVETLVRDLRPGKEDPVSVTSLLALQSAHENGVSQPNDLFALKTRAQMLAERSEKVRKAAAVENWRDLEELAFLLPAERTPWQKARLKMKHRILSTANREQDKQARRELITLSSQVLKDTHISIESRLVRTLISTDNVEVRRQVEAILNDVAPHRAERLHTLAMN